MLSLRYLSSRRQTVTQVRYGCCATRCRSISDYWRFIASEEGYYVFFTRGLFNQTPPVIRVLSITTGQDVWSYTMTNVQERPLLACHDGSLYVIGRSQQLKMSLATGAVLWQQNNSFPNDNGYLHANYESGAWITSDPLYRPMVLTDDSMWFVNGDARGSGTLVGLRTSDGSIIQQINLATLYSGTESLDYVNDLMTADGRLGLLVSVSDTNDPNHAVAYYQDLHVYQSIPANMMLINASAGPGGAIDPTGDVFVTIGGSQTFNIATNSGYVLNDVWNYSLIEVLDSGEVKVQVPPLDGLSLGYVGPGAWHHVAVRYNERTHTLDGFLDGVKSANSSSGVRQAPWDAAYQVYYAFGAAAYLNMGSGQFFHGTIDDLRIYNGPMDNADIEALATAGPSPCTLSVTNVGTGQGTVLLNPPGGTYTVGQVVTLTAVPAGDSAFGGWGKDLRGVANPATIVVDADRQVTATFSRPPILGDINSDSFVNVGDLQILVASWGRTNGEPGYNSRADLDGNRTINVGDLQVLVAHWAQHY